MPGQGEQYLIYSRTPKIKMKTILINRNRDKVQIFRY